MQNLCYYKLLFTGIFQKININVVIFERLLKNPIEHIVPVMPLL